MESLIARATSGCECSRGCESLLARIEKLEDALENERHLQEQMQVTVKDISEKIKTILDNATCTIEHLAKERARDRQQLMRVQDVVNDLFKFANHPFMRF